MAADLAVAAGTARAMSGAIGTALMLGGPVVLPAAEQTQLGQDVAYPGTMSARRLYGGAVVPRTTSFGVNLGARTR